MGVFGSILGIFGMISYLFGGIVADRFSTRMILTVSLIGTGLGGFVHLLPLNYYQLLALYAFWGISSLFAFWPACVKAVRILSDSDDQGKAYGFFEGGRGVGAALMAMGAVVAFRIGIGQINDEVAGMKTVIVYYSVLTIAMGIFCFFKVKDGHMEASERIYLVFVLLYTICHIYFRSHSYFWSYTCSYETMVFFIWKRWWRLLLR